MRFCLTLAGVFALASLAVAGDCRRVNLVSPDYSNGGRLVLAQEVADHCDYVQPVVVQRVVQRVVQPVVVQHVQQVQHVQEVRHVQQVQQVRVVRQNVYSGGQAFTQRQRFSGGGGERAFGGLFTRQGILSTAGAAIGAAASGGLGAPAGAAIGAALGNVIGGR